MPLKSFWILLGSFLFTLMAMCAKICAEHFSIFEIMLYRAAASIVVIGGYMLARRIPFGTAYPMAHFRRCAAGICCFYTETLALTMLPLGLTQALGYTSPLFMAVFMIVSALAFGRDKVEWPLVGTVAAGFVGVLLIIKPSSAGMNAAGAALALVSAFFGASASWFIRDLGRQGEPPVRAVFIFMLANFAAGLAGTALSEEGFHSLDAAYLAPLSGVIVTGLFGQTIWTFAWAAGHAMLNAVFQYAGIFWGVAVGIALLGESVDALSACGMTAVFAAGVYSSLYLNVWRKRKP
ncbi:MAG: DMT family transporter [Duodenibacillus sp.]|nr:DMT family transporter [Duodenibacillus sp.]